MRVEFFKHNLNEDDIKEVVKTLEEYFITTGPKVAEFEKALRKFLGLPEVVGVTSCTQALHLSFLGLGVEEGDQVITSPLTFVATSNSILYTGAELKFCDVLPKTGCIDPKQIETSISPNTKAILPIHLYGELCNMKEIKEVAERHKLFIVEDAAHSLETKGVGQGDTVCFSFYPVKSITCGEGGAIACKSTLLAEKLRVLRLHGMSKDAWKRYQKEYQHWDMEEVGLKANMTDIDASLLLHQLERVKDFVLKRTKLYLRYKELLKDIEEIELLESSSTSSKLMFTILTQKGKRDKVLTGLQNKGVGVAVNFNPIHLLSYYRKTFGYKPGDFPVAEDIGSRTISLPLYPKLTLEEQDYVVKSIKETLKEV